MSIMNLWINSDFDKLWLKPIMSLSCSHDLKVVEIDVTETLYLNFSITTSAIYSEHRELVAEIIKRQ